MRIPPEPTEPTNLADSTSTRPAAAPAPTHSRWTRARLVEPSTAGWVYLGASSGPWRVPPALPRARRRVLLRLMHTAAAVLRRDPGVQRADVFRGLLRPPAPVPCPANTPLPAPSTRCC